MFMTPVMIHWMIRMWTACAVLVTLALGASVVLPDGGEVVFAGYRADGERGIYRVDVDTRLIFRIGDIRGGCCIMWARGSPEIAMINYAGRVVFLNADGRGERILDRDRLLYTMSDWSPDGTQFVAPATDSPDDLQIMNTSGERARRLPDLSREDGSVINPRWSPDAQHILYTISGGEQGIYTLDLSAGEARRIINHSSVKRIDWSPDGEQIVFVSQQNGLSKIFLMRADGSESRPLLSSSETVEYEPLWSPDGSKIAFMSNKSRRLNLHVMACDPACDGETRQLTRSGLIEWTYAWSPDSSKLAVIAAASEGIGVFVIDANGDRVQPISDGFSLISTLAWRP